MWGLEEDLLGIWPYILYTQDRGVMHLMSGRNKMVLLEFPWSRNFKHDMKSYNPIFVNFNDASQTDKKNIMTRAMNDITKNYKIDLFKYNII